MFWVKKISWNCWLRTPHVCADVLFGLLLHLVYEYLNVYLIFVWYFITGNLHRDCMGACPAYLLTPLFYLLYQKAVIAAAVLVINMQQQALLHLSGLYIHLWGIGVHHLITSVWVLHWTTLVKFCFGGDHTQSYHYALWLLPSYQRQQLAVQMLCNTALHTFWQVPLQRSNIFHFTYVHVL